MQPQNMMPGATNLFYRVVVLTALLLVILLALALPDRMMEPDDWAYYYAAENFSHGRLVVDDQLHNQQFAEARAQGGNLIQYINPAPNRWALEKAPGTALFIVPFHMLGIPQGANVILLVGTTLATYLMLKRLKDEKTACIGSILLLFTTVFLIMLCRPYMDTFSGSAFLFIGCALYIYYCLGSPIENKHQRWWLMVAFLFIAWSVVARYTNLPVAAVFALHYAATRLTLVQKGQAKQVTREIVPVVLGVGIPLTVLLTYHTIVFGSPFDYGYHYTKLPIKFAFQYIGQLDPQGNAIALNIVKENLQKMPGPLFIGFPLLAIALPGLIYLVYRQTNAWFKRIPSGDATNGLPADLLWLLTGWFLCVFPLYLLYEWTAQQPSGRPFIIVARFYLPGLLPLVVVAATLMTRWASKLVIILLVVITAMGIAVATQATVKGMGTAGVDRLPALQTPGRPGQFNPPVQQPPLNISPEVINRTRQEVKTNPTNPQNADFRLAVLRGWVNLLSQQGLKVGLAAQPEKITAIEELLRSGKRIEAANRIDAVYRQLEQLVGNP